MSKFNKDAVKAQWLAIIDRFGEEEINHQLWRGTFADARKYFLNRMPTQTPSEITHHGPPKARLKAL